MKRLISFILAISVILTVSSPAAFAETAAEPKVIAVEGSRSGEISHPYPRNDFMWMLLSAERTALRLPNEQKEEKVAALRKMTPDEIEEHIKELASKLNNTGSRPAWEENFLHMATLSQDLEDEYLEKQAVAMLYAYAVAYKDIAIRPDASIYSATGETPGYCVFSYDLLFNSPYWDVLTEKYGTDSRAVVENWFKDVFDRVYRVNRNSVMGNYAGYWIKHLAGIAAVLNDPDRMRNVIEHIDTALCQYNYYGDGMWREGTFSYAQMMVGNCDEAINVIKLYKDPEDYVDTKFGLKLDNTDLRSRWPARSAHMKNINGKMVFPNGSSIALNDTHYTRGVNADTPIKAELLEENIELNHFGLYGLKYGNGEEAQQMNLSFQAISEGLPYSSGHAHGSALALTLWSAGMEILPDGGYVFSPAVNRYLHMHAAVHNMSWVYSPKAPSYSSRGTQYMRPNTLAYDNGDTNGKQVQLIEAETPHTEQDFVDMKRRAVFMIAVDENHSYTVDFQRLKGGTVHENFLRQVEEEDVELTTSLTLPAPLNKTLTEAIKGKGKSGGVITTLPQASFIKQPQIVQTDEAFDFTWKGVDTGTSMHAFIKGVEKSTVAFSKFPTMRRVDNREAVKDDFPGYHYYHRIDVKPTDITTFGGVYEGIRDGEEGNVKAVEWIDAPDKDKMTHLVKITLDEFVDYVYISGDKKSRKYGDVIFAGNYAVLRINKTTGEAVWKYIYGAGAIIYNGETFNGGAEYCYKVISASGMPDLENVPNTLRIQGVLPRSVKGHFGHTIYGDGSGVGFEIKNINTSVVTLNNTPGFTVTEKGAKMETFPAFINPVNNRIPTTARFYYEEDAKRTISGDVWFEVKIPAFSKNK